MTEYKLTETDQKAIKWGMHHSEKAEVRQRATGIHLLHQGYRVVEVSEMLAVSVATIYNWHQRWRSEGLKGLENRPKSGRPRNSDEGYCQLLGEVVETEPSEQGYGFGVWTLDRLREHMRQKTGISLSKARFRVLMKELGYVYRRPKHDVKSLQDAEAVEKARQSLDELKKEVSQENLSWSLWTKV